MTAQVEEAAVLNALRNVKDPDLGRDIVALGFVKDVKICGGQVGFTIELTTPACPVREQLKGEAARVVGAIPGVETVNVKMTSQVRATSAERAAQLIPDVKNVVPIASGKGGVGKSTVSVNLALSLAQTGAKVGIMDADVYGPSVPTMLGVREDIVARGNRFVPAERFGIKMISTASMIRGRAAILRGPMLHKVIEQFLGQTEWGELDYLIVDLPPGTGDIHLSLCQMIPLTGAAIVSTPQDVALQVAEKAILMFEQLRTPVLGVIENMSYFECEHGTRYEIFGHGGAQRYCQGRGIPFLGEIPLAVQIRTASDSGEPVVVADPNSEYARAFMRVAKNLAAQVSVQALGGGASADGREPKRVEQPSRREIVLEWKDGHVSRFDPFKLRAACACATCVDENTGKQVLREESIAEDVWAQSISPVGRYGLQIVWSDGHSTGIYTFERLRGMCPCDACRRNI